MVGACPLASPSLTGEEEALLRQGYRDLLSDARDGLVFRPASDRDVSKEGLPS